MRIKILLLAATLVACQSAGVPGDDENGFLPYNMKSIVRSVKDDAKEENEMVNISYPQFTESAAAGRINGLITRTIASMINDSLALDAAADRFVEEYEQFKNEFPQTAQFWQFSAVAKVSMNTGKTLTLDCDMYNYSGGAHGNSLRILLSLHPRTGERIKLSEIIRADKSDAFIKFAEQQLRKERDIPPHQSLADAGFWFKDDRFYLSENFGILPDGLLFIYNPYEIAPYVAGRIELFINNENLKPFLKE